MYLISDTHFYHKNILIYENRPFANIEEMDDKLIINWNSVISKRDEIWHLGDFCFGNQERVKQIVSQLNGRIHLILGNHDGTHSYKWWIDCGFEFISKYPILYKDKFLLSHRPLDYKLLLHYNIHGHVHGKTDYDTYGKEGYYNVSVEVLDYKPISLDNLLKGDTMDKKSIEIGKKSFDARYEEIINSNNIKLDINDYSKFTSDNRTNIKLYTDIKSYRQNHEMS